MRAVLFDFDGVLADTGQAIDRVACHALEAAGINISEREYGERFHGVGGADWRSRITMLYLEFGVAISEASIDDLQAAITEAAVTATAAIPGIKNLWDRVQVARGIVSSCPHGELVRKVEKLGLLGISILVAGEDVERVKPCADPYLLAASRLCVRPEECVVIEDSASGVRSGKAAGAFTILFTASHRSETDTARLVELTKPDQVAGSSGELKAILLQLGVIKES